MQQQSTAENRDIHEVKGKAISKPPVIFANSYSYFFFQIGNVNNDIGVRRGRGLQV